MDIQNMKLADIKTYPRNAKLHPAEQIEQIKNSIQTFGFNDPVGIWGPENEIVEGHGRYIAAQELGIEEIPCIRLDELSDEERRAYALVHNQLTMNTGWDNLLLDQEISDLDFDMSEFGFDLDDIDDDMSGFFENMDDNYGAKVKTCPYCGHELP